jgi:hypothetical protein
LSSSNAGCLGTLEWNTVLFTDEFHFHVDFSDGYACAWKGRIEWFYPKKVIQRYRYDGGSVMIWDKIGYVSKQSSSK